MGLAMATLLVIMNMVGTGIFLLPASMASIGSISIWGWVFATIGATGIGLVFALLGMVDPKEGGPYAYARDTFGRYVGFQTNYVYWTANLVGNVAVATTVTGYLTVFFPELKHPVAMTACSVGVIWIATGVNMLGARWVGNIAGWSAGLALIPVTALAVLGWFWFDPTLFEAGWDPHHQGVFSAISSSAVFALWAYMGVESAAVTAGVIENPKRNVPLATILGLGISAVLYISTCTVLMGMIPMQTLATSSAPFVDAAKMMAGPIAGTVMALCAIVKAGASLIGWTLTISQISYATAKDGMFPPFYRSTDRRGIPQKNLAISGMLMTVIVLATASPSLNSQFNRIIDMSIILVILPYLYSAVALVPDWLQHGGRHNQMVGLGAVVLVACAYCFWVVMSSSPDLLRDAMVFLFLSIPLYALILRKQPPALAA